MATTVRSLSEMYLSKFRAILRFPNLIGSKSIYDILKLNYEDLRRVIEDGEQYAAVSIFSPAEIMSACGIHYLPLEPVVATASQFGVFTEFGAECDNILRFNTCCCGGQSIVALYEREILAKPKYLLASSHMCDDSLKNFNFLSRYYNIPIFNLDIPFKHNEGAIAYVADQLKVMADFICEQENTEFDYENLKEAVRISNNTNMYRQQIFSMIKQYPLVFKLSQILPQYPLYIKFGRKEVEDIYRSFAAEYKEMVDAQKWCFQGDYYKLLWLGMIPLVYPKFMKYMESLKFGFPMTELLIHSDCAEMVDEDPFETIAKKLMNYPLVGNVTNRVDKIDGIITDCGIEGVIIFNHRGCISFNGDNFIISDYLKSKDIPHVILEGDIALHEYNSIEKLEESLSVFRSILEDKYGAK